MNRQIGVSGWTPEQLHGIFVASAASMSQGGGAAVRRRKTRLAKVDDAVMDQLFDQIDVDGSGQVDPDELYGLMKSRGIQLTDEQLDQMMGAADTARCDALLKRTC